MFLFWCAIGKCFFWEGGMYGACDSLHTAAWQMNICVSGPNLSGIHSCSNIGRNLSARLQLIQHVQLATEPTLVEAGSRYHGQFSEVGLACSHSGSYLRCWWHIMRCVYVVCYLQILSVTEKTKNHLLNFICKIEGTQNLAASSFLMLSPGAVVKLHFQTGQNHKVRLSLYQNILQYWGTADCKSAKTAKMLCKRVKDVLYRLSLI